MTGFRPLLLLLATALVGQTPQVPQRDASEPALLIEKLPPAAYPPIARAARVWGEVQISLQIRSDGTVSSAEAVGGPPMLRQAAMDAVKQARFECKNCNSDLIPFTLTYRYEFAPGVPCSPRDNSYPRITSSQVTITVQDQPVWLCDPGGSVSKRVRSAKCLYLWKCGQH
jgi:TonB family protein